MRNCGYSSFGGRNGNQSFATGGSKGIGLAVAARFAASGADVAIVARSADPLKEAVAAIRIRFEIEAGGPYLPRHKKPFPKVEASCVRREHLTTT